jgi:hypothetical protein
MSDDIEQLTAERDHYKSCTLELGHQLAQFHEAMQRERKPDWEKWHMDLADRLDKTQNVFKYKEFLRDIETAASELRYMATSFTLKANFVPTDLEIKALKSQVESLEKQVALWRDCWQRGRGRVYANFGHVPEALRACDWINIDLQPAIDATTAGRDYKSPEEYAKLEKQCAAMRRLIERYGSVGPPQDEIIQVLCGTTAGRDYFKVCPACGHSEKGSL